MPRTSRGACRQQPRRRPPDPRCSGPPGPAWPLLLARISRPVKPAGTTSKSFSLLPKPKISGSSETPNVPRSWKGSFTGLVGLWEISKGSF
eukprot:3905313-Pyramimonas_sp.AAC.1